MESAVYILNGFLLGVIVTISMQLFLVFRYVFRQSKSALSSSTNQVDLKPAFDAPGRPGTADDWPQEVKDYLQKLLLSTSTHATTSNDAETPAIMAFNAWVHRFYIECRFSRIFHVRMEQLLMSKLSRWFNPESSGSLLVQSVAIAELTFGNQPPVFQRIALNRPQQTGNAIEDIVRLQRG
jgi:hypothetical protein